MSNTINFVSNIHSFEKRLNEVCSRVNRKRSGVEVVFAAKYIDKDDLCTFIEKVYDLYKREILVGENRVQDASEKMEFIKTTRPDLLEKFKCLMIGNLQKNKINKAIGIFSAIHAVDSLDLAKALDERMKIQGKKMPVYLEVNVSGEQSKHGFNLSNIDQAIETIKKLNSLDLQGLMTMAPFSENPEEARKYFKILKKLADAYSLKTSMGMSNDWEVAVEEGADLIRVGSIIFN